MTPEQFTALIELIEAIAERQIEVFGEDGYACQGTNDKVKHITETAHKLFVTNSAGSETSPDARARPETHVSI